MTGMAQSQAPWMVSNGGSATAVDKAAAIERLRALPIYEGVPASTVEGGAAAGPRFVDLLVCIRPCHLLVDETEGAQLQSWLELPTIHGPFGKQNASSLTSIGPTH